MGSITETKRVEKATGKTITIHRAYIRREGYAPKSKVFRTKTEARNWLRDNESAATLTKGSSGMTFAALVEVFVKAPPEKGFKYWVASQLDFWNAHLGKLKVSEITRGDINAAKAKLQVKEALHNTPTGPVATGARITPATVNRYLASLASVFNYAVKMDILDSHPMKGGKVGKLTESNGRTRILTPDEEAKLFKAAAESDWPMLSLFLKTCLTSAARKSEVLKLRWQQLRLEDSIAVLGKTKNGRPRALPLVDEVREALVAAYEVRPENSEFVFYDPKHLGRPKNIDTVWKACRVSAGLFQDTDDKLDRVYLHSTRHTGVTKMLKGGANLAQAAAVSGHQTLAMLKKYEHLAAADTVALAQRLLSK